MASMLGSSGDANSTRAKFWENMSYELFSNVLGLYEQIDAFFSHRSSDEGFPAMIVFCVYICGSLASYLWKWPQSKQILLPSHVSFPKYPIIVHACRYLFT